jgi:hypothetical protein
METFHLIDASCVLVFASFAQIHVFWRNLPLCLICTNRTSFIRTRLLCRRSFIFRCNTALQLKYANGYNNLSSFRSVSVWLMVFMTDLPQLRRYKPCQILLFCAIKERFYLSGIRFTYEVCKDHRTQQGYFTIASTLLILFERSPSFMAHRKITESSCFFFDNKSRRL